MNFVKTIVTTNTEGSDLVSSILLSNGCNGTTIIDKNDLKETTLSEQQIKELTEFYPTECLVVGVIEKEDANVELQRIKNELTNLKSSNNFGKLELRTEIVNSEHWTDIWQDYYNPYIVGKLKIYGIWQKRSHDLFKIPIILNPGAAFGTGQHPTTESTLILLQKLNLKNKIILDVGSGSGILGISAIKLGAKFAYLIDIDDVAIQSSELNASTNKISEKVSINKVDIVYTPNKELVGDILLVNIDSETDLDYANNILNNINPNGYVILSGITTINKEKVQKAYENIGFKLIEAKQKEDWSTLLMHKE